MGVFLGPAVNLLTARSRHRRGTLNVHKFLRGRGGWGDCITARNKEEERLAASDGTRPQTTAGKKQSKWTRNHCLTLAI